LDSLKATDLLDIGSNLSEVISVCETTYRWIEIPDMPRKDMYSIAIGYSNKKRILLIVGRFLTFKLEFLAVKLPEEIEIEKYYCNY
jgi:hypothetical protein